MSEISTILLRKCSKCGFDMTGRVIDPGVTIYRCPLGHKYIDTHARPSDVRPSRKPVFPNDLEHK